MKINDSLFKRGFATDIISGQRAEALSINDFTTNKGLYYTRLYYLNDALELISNETTA